GGGGGPAGVVHVGGAAEEVIAVGGGVAPPVGHRGDLPGRVVGGIGGHPVRAGLVRQPAARAVVVGVARRVGGGARAGGPLDLGRGQGPAAVVRGGGGGRPGGAR